jgi:hypothetical protein
MPSARALSIWSGIGRQPSGILAFGGPSGLDALGFEGGKIGSGICGSDKPEPERVRSLSFWFWFWFWLALRSHCVRIGWPLFSLPFSAVYASEICFSLCIVTFAFSRPSLCHLVSAAAFAAPDFCSEIANSLPTRSFQSAPSAAPSISFPSAISDASTREKLPAGMPQSRAKRGRSICNGSPRSYIIMISVV